MGQVSRSAFAVIVVGVLTFGNARAGETADTNAPSGKDRIQEILLKTDSGCYNVAFPESPGSVISCSEPVSVRYTKRACQSGGHVEEIGQVDAVTSCEVRHRVTIRFRTAKGAVRAVLRVRRQSDGRSGIVSVYEVQEAGVDESAIAQLLPKPELQSLDARVPEETPLRTKLFGFAFTEYEALRNFGSSAANFAHDGDDAGNSDLTFLMNLGAELSKDRTKLNMLFEVGELFFGNRPSGGGQGARGIDERTVEVRNLFINHEWNDHYSVKSGIMTLNSDPRGFVFSDNVAATQLTYNTDLSEGMIWFGKASASSNRSSTGFGTRTGKDYYAGISGTIGFLSSLRANAFLLGRFTDTTTWALPDGTTATPTTFYGWGGTNFGYTFAERLAVDAVFIANDTRARAGDFAQKDFSYLGDLKIAYSKPDSPFNLSLEGLITTGATGAEDAAGNPLMGSAKRFNSVVNTSYLMSLATSDGVDDAPGAPRVTGTVAGLSQTEGLTLGIASVGYNLSKRTTLIGRAGLLRTLHVNTAVNSKDLGREYDLSAVHQLTPSTLVQLDLAALDPGTAQGPTRTHMAKLSTLKVKFSF